MCISVHEKKDKNTGLQFLVHVFSKSIFHERAYLSGLHGHLLQIHIYYVLATCNKMTDCHSLRANQALISFVKSAGIWLCNAVLHAQAQLFLQPHLVPHSEESLSQLQKLFLHQWHISQREHKPH